MRGAVFFGKEAIQDLNSPAPRKRRMQQSSGLLHRARVNRGWPTNKNAPCGMRGAQRAKFVYLECQLELLLRRCEYFA